MRMQSMNFEALVVHQSEVGGSGGVGNHLKGGAPPSRERLAALQADLKAHAAATVAADRTGGGRDSGRAGRFPGRNITGR